MSETGRLTRGQYKKVVIGHAKAVSRATGARQVVVCCFYHDKYGVTSYGVTKAECKDVARLCDAIADGLYNGTLPVPGDTR